MNNDNLIIQSSEGTIEYIGDSLLESALKKDMEFPLGCSAGMICDNDHYLLLVLRTEILTSEIKKILESICGGKLPQDGSAFAAGTFSDHYAPNLMKVGIYPEGNEQNMLDTVFDGYRIAVNKEKNRYQFTVNNQKVLLPLKEESVFLVLFGPNGIKFFRTCSQREIKKILESRKFENSWDGKRLKYEKKEPEEILEPVWVEALLETEKKEICVFQSAGQLWCLRKLHAAKESDKEKCWEVLNEEEILKQIREYSSMYGALDEQLHAMEVQGGYTFGLWGNDEKIMRIRSLLQKAAATNTTILLTGESGTGKTFLAKEIHKGSRRQDAAFVHVNCAAIPYQLIESELFGYEDGAFTGARKGGKAGYFEIAEGGTLFLDEITELPLSLQGKLLEVLQNRTYFRVGGEKKKHANIRLIAATNKNMKEMVKQQNFREDLYYRINVFPIQLPPLRERMQSFFSITRDLIPEICDRLEVGQQVLSPGALKKMETYDWPGNIRELENVIEKACILSNGRMIMAEDIELPIRQGNRENQKSVHGNSLRQQKEDFEKEIIRKTLEETGGSRVQAAQLLQIGKTSLFEKIKKYGLEEGSREEREDGEI